MKKAIALLSMISLLSSNAAVVNANDDIKVTLNGNAIKFDVQPQIISDFTMVPLRAIFEALGASVDWTQETQTITSVKDDTTIVMAIGSDKMYINGKEQALEAIPCIVNDSTLVPVRAISESFGLTVDWNQDTQTVILVTPTTEPAVTVTPSTVAPVTSETPAPTSTTAPVVTPTTTPIADSSSFPITYNQVSERGNDSVSRFSLKSVEKNADGKYDITYYFETFLEGSGSVTAKFNCLDSTGKVIDSFGGTFRTTDYTWSPHTEKATIPGDTKTIELYSSKTN